MLKSSFGFERAEDSPGFLLWQTTVSWQRLLKKILDPYGVSHAQFVILAVLLWFEETDQKPIQSAIVCKTKLDKMTVSSVLKRLVAEGFVVRYENRHDTRAKSVSLTNKGRALSKKLVPAVEEADSLFFGQINSKDQKHLVKLLNNLVYKFPEG